jgi:hypothetical protein
MGFSLGRTWYTSDTGVANTDHRLDKTQQPQNLIPFSQQCTDSHDEIMNFIRMCDSAYLTTGTTRRRNYRQRAHTCTERHDEAATGRKQSLGLDHHPQTLPTVERPQLVITDVCPHSTGRHIPRGALSSVSPVVSSVENRVCYLVYSSALPEE